MKRDIEVVKRLPMDEAFEVLSQWRRDAANCRDEEYRKVILDGVNNLRNYIVMRDVLKGKAEELEKLRIYGQNN